MQSFWMGDLTRRGVEKGDTGLSSLSWESLEEQLWECT